MDEKNLKCKSCGGDMEFDKSSKMLVCPYCGYKEMLTESDVVQVERIRNQTYKDVELGKQQIELEKQKMYYDQQNKIRDEEKKKKHLIWWILGWILFFPIPLTILIVRSKKLDFKKKAIILAVLWIVVILIGALSGDDEDNADSNSSLADSTVVSQAVNSEDEEEEKEEAESKAESKKKEETEESKDENSDSKSAETLRKEIEDAFANNDYSLVTPEFKESMDSYEEFYDSYIEFMEKYDSADTDNALEMLSDYNDFLTKLDEMNEALDSIDESELTLADDLYYLKVSASIEAKLLAYSAS